MGLVEAQKERIEAIIRSDRVVLFMKGTRRFPQCGFSSSVVDILDEMIESYTTVNVLDDAELRESIKEYSSWPTIPQLYIAGEFVGGADIVREMLQNGELSQKLGASGEPIVTPPPKLTVSEAAKRAFLEASNEAPSEFLRFEVSPRFEYGLFFGPRQPSDVEVDLGGMVMLLDKQSARRAEGVVIDFVTGPEGGGFRIENPQEPPKVRPLSPKNLAEMLKRGDALELIDVRTPREYDIASLDEARLLDREELRRLEGLPKETPIVFLCHHGIRSRSAAEHFVALGFTRIYNLEGGMDAWSVSVDPTVPRY